MAGVPLSWPAAGRSSFIVYKLTGILYFKVVGTSGLEWERRTLGTRWFTVRTRTCENQFFLGTWQALAFLFASSE